MRNTHIALIVAMDGPSKASKVTEAFLTSTNWKGQMTRQTEAYSYIY